MKGTTMRRIARELAARKAGLITPLAVAAGIVLLTAGLSAPAASLTAAHGATTITRACNEQVAWDYYPGGSPAFSEAKWTANSCGHYLRGVAHCSNGTRSAILQLGGWVTSLNLWSKASCTTSYPTMIGAAYDTKNCGSCSFTRHWLFGHAKQP